MSDQIAVLTHQIAKAQGRLRAADLHSWDEGRKAVLRADLAALKVRKAIFEATEHTTLTADDAASLAALIAERVA